LTVCDPSSPERSLPWIRARARYYARRWTSLDVEELEGAILVRWLTAGKPPKVRWVAIDLLRKTIGDERCKPRDQNADFCGHRELHEPPEDRSSVAIDAYVLECRALGATCTQTAQELGVTAQTVQARLRRIDSLGPRRMRQGALRRGASLHRSILGERLGSGT
jgi:hypothetical protein